MNKPNIKCLISGEQTEGKVSVFEEIVPPHSGPPLHIHTEQFEIFHVISGVFEFEMNSKRIERGAGETVLIPPGARHTFLNKSDESAVLHFSLLPSGDSEVFFEKLVQGDFEDVQVLFEEHGLKLCGPPIR
jgi:quercetin dioxygenase-like cupin family protein